MKCIGTAGHPLPQGGEGWIVRESNGSRPNWKLQTVGFIPRLRDYSCSYPSGSKPGRRMRSILPAAKSSAAASRAIPPAQTKAGL